MAAPVGAGALAAARLRGPGAGTFECSSRAISPARRRGQSADLSTIDRRPVLSPAPAANADGVADTLGDLHAQEPVAAFFVVFGDFSIRGERVLARSGRSRRWRRGAARAPVHRENRPRTSRRTSAAPGRSDSRRVGRAARTVSVPGARGGIRAPLESAGLRVGAGRAGKHGCARVHHGAPEAAPRGPAVAFGAAFCVGESRHWLSEGARHRTANAAGAGVRKLTINLASSRPAAGCHTDADSTYSPRPWSLSHCCRSGAVSVCS